MIQSKNLFQQAQKRMPGGVNSPVRAFRSVGGTPRFFKKAKGAILTDVDGNEYIDYVNSWGPMILGHAHPQVTKALQKTAAFGTSFGAPNPYEIELAQAIQKLYPSLEKIRMVNSGTEAVMAALRLARAFTGRDKIIKFEGCYHGHTDSLLVKAGSGALTFGVPTSAGVPAEFAKSTLTAPYNNIEAVKSLFRANPKQIAAIILEPVVGNSGLILPQKDFLKQLRALTLREKTLLIFDEVMTGFRVDLKGAQGLYKIQPDITTLGKVIGGGLPVGAFGGRADIMDLLAPIGPVYQAGTLSGNPLAMVAGIETLKLLSKKGVFAQIQKKTQFLVREIQKRAKRFKIPLQVLSQGTMMGLFFSDRPVHNLEQAMNSRVDLFNRFFHLMLEQGIYLPPSAYEAWFVSAAHTSTQLQKTLKAVEKSFQELTASGGT
ncbi:MAG: glutamate-1-semialdehyde 2,1-aminomutase [Deltaproteobacteria bacterium]|nr:glutamate-1-semialdehyde 2,1-aminomutase [Deltaproteobacteria bacterium]